MGRQLQPLLAAPLVRLDMRIYCSNGDWRVVGPSTASLPPPASLTSLPSPCPTPPPPEEYHRECVRLVTRLHQWDVLRANKAPFAFGLETRVPFLDKQFLQVTG